MALNNAQQYVRQLNKYFGYGQMTEHSYRPYLLQYLETLLPDCKIINEPKRSRVGAPDFILFDQKNIPFAYIETKDIGKKLNDKAYKEQFDRYKSGLDMLIITDYLEFQLYERGVFKQSVKIAEVQGDKIVPYEVANQSLTEGVALFERMVALLNDNEGVNITIKSAEDLAERMAKKARFFADVIFRALEDKDDAFEIADGSLAKQFQSFQKILIGDISHAAFADIYAQTIAYGMFAARIHDPTLETFSRQEAADLIPKSNPFLRKLFQYVASHDLDDRIVWYVDDLAKVFRYTDVKAILADFGRKTQQTDPFIHFYETFLAAHDASLRKARGVWYTPQPVVNFIVRAVDDILKSEFGLRDGLADTSKTTIEVKTQNYNKRKKDYDYASQDVHRVQLLDPACGTGTFLAEVVRAIHKRFVGQTGIWNGYVEQHLIPRLHGFELLMASYAMAHIKMDMLLRETGYTAKAKDRFKIYLTNTLEAHHKDAGTLFWAQWLADEAAQADAVKRDAPVMVVLGNPPYSVSSSNKSEWIEDLMKDYKKDLNERNIQPLSDDYIKFIRFGQHFIDKNTEGVLAYISNNSFIDGLIHRQMRKSLLESFDKIYILDLHGSAKRQETALDGSSDQNVFDIQQGVSISFFIKTGKKKKGQLADVYHTDLYGTRNLKYQTLLDNSLKTIDWTKLDFTPPQYFFVKKDFDVKIEYEKGFLVSELFTKWASGITTERDNVCIHFDENTLKKIKNDLESMEIEQFRSKHTPKPDGRDWKIETAKDDLKKNKGIITNVLYRPFDIRKTIYTGKSKGFHSYPRHDIMQHLCKPNLSLIFERQNIIGDFTNVFISDKIVESHILGTAYSKGLSAPLYLYPDSKDLFATNERVPNLKKEIVDKLGTVIGRRLGDKGFAPEDLLDYIYAVLHTPQYRETYKEFLKIDFPRVPYPKDAQHFDALVKQGAILRGLHLLESDDVDTFITSYPNDGDNIVGKPKYENGKVWLNGTQYFEGVPEVAWQFYIGGYQPAQKWLKDRIGRRLDFEDIRHYQRMIVALTRTADVMAVLDGLY